MTLLLALAPTWLAAQEGTMPTEGRALSIQETIVAASPALASARAALDAASARLGGAGFSPAAVLSAEIEDLAGGTDIGAATVRVEVGREFLTGGRSAAARALATTDVRGAELHVELLERRLRAEVLAGLTRLAITRAVDARLVDADAVLESAQGSLVDRFSVGSARYLDVLRLQTERLRIQTDRSALLADERAALEGLLGLVGPEAGAGLLIQLSDPVLALEIAEGAALPPTPGLDSLVARSGPVVRAMNALDRGRGEVVSVRAETRVRFAGSLGVQTFSEPGSSGRSVGPVAGGSITLPFTASRVNQAAARSAQLELDRAEADLAAARAQMAGHLGGDIARYESARERLAVFDEGLLGAAREGRENALALFRSGDLSLVELLDFERAVMDAEIERLRSREAALRAYADLVAGGDSADSGGEER